MWIKCFETIFGCKRKYFITKMTRRVRTVNHKKYLFDFSFLQYCLLYKN